MVHLDYSIVKVEDRNLMGNTLFCILGKSPDTSYEKEPNYTNFNHYCIGFYHHLFLG